MVLNRASTSSYLFLHCYTYLSIHLLYWIQWKNEDLSRASTWTLSVDWIERIVSRMIPPLIIMRFNWSQAPVFSKPTPHYKNLSRLSSPEENLCRVRKSRRRHMTTHYNSVDLQMPLIQNQVFCNIRGCGLIRGIQWPFAIHSLHVYSNNNFRLVPADSRGQRTRKTEV